ncbi:MAG: AMP-dependent synthetase/ligase [Blastococcus sp.]
MTDVVRGDTVVDALAINARTLGDRPAMRYRSNHDWQTITWTGYFAGAREVCAGLAELGVGRGEHVGILSGNRPEWHLADLGSLANGCVTVPIYQTNSVAQVEYILGHSGARVCFVDTHEQLGKVLDARRALPKLDHVVVFDGTGRSDDTSVTGFADLRARGAERLRREPGLYDERSALVAPDDIATLVYTSGTTGPPKGVELTHSNVLWTLRHVTPPYRLVEGERLVSFLPLSHIAERMMSEFLTIAMAGETWFARSLATVVEDLPACHPTVFFAVPRVWEKLRDGVQRQVLSQPRPVRSLFDRYVALGLRRVAEEQDGAPFGLLERLQYAALDRTLGARVRRELGLDRAHVMITAAAPAHPNLLRWLHAIGLPVVELYGQSEGCGPTTANRLERNRIGTVGPALPGISVRIADDGEILVQGGNVCLGYHEDPVGTARLIDADGWMHSGDLGAFEPDGYLRIIGRKKDLIITAGGQNIAPQNIENDLRDHHLISQAVVLGEGRRYLAALITLDPDALLAWGHEHGDLADTEALAADPAVVAEVQAAVDEVNASRSQAEHIRKFRILTHDFSVAEGELTPTLKVKRAEVYARYADVIDELYGEPA